MITHTISLLELLWTIIALVGLGFITALFVRTCGDYIIAKHYNGSKQLRLYAAMTSVLIFTGGLLTQISYVAVGIVAMTQPSTHEHTTTANYITASIFIIASFISVIFAILIYRRRVKIIEILEQMH